jgi:hypothetical protein
MNSALLSPMVDSKNAHGIIASFDELELPNGDEGRMYAGALRHGSTRCR